MLKNVLLLTHVSFWASSRYLKTYFFEVHLVFEVVFVDRADGLLFDLHCWKVILLLPLSWSDGRRAWFSVSCHFYREFRSYVYFHFKSFLYIWKELLL